MFSPFIGIIAWLSLMGMCQGDLERSNLSPLSIVYTIYPYYNSETLLGYLKTGESLELSRNDAPAGRNAQIRDNQNGVDAGLRDETSRNSNNRDSRDDPNELTRQRTEQANSEITYWPPIQRGAVPKPRAGRAAAFVAGNLKNV